MQLEKLTFIHFFVDNKEYALEIETIKYASIKKDTFSIFFVAKDIPAVADFFLKKSEEEFLFFFGNCEEKYDSPVISKTGMFEKTVLDKDLFGIQFKNTQG